MNSTIQNLIFCDSRKLSKKIPGHSVNLVITSPPYPMIEMWDELFSKLNNKITKQLIQNNPMEAFELMHKELDKVYDECLKTLRNDGIVCINIGDATRTIDGLFRMFPNATRTIQYFLSKGFSQLPSIIWHKPTNSPNKFMGSGMLPVGAYNTLEHEHILIFRKEKRIFTSNEEKQLRRHSAFFQYERNLWCQDIWRVLGIRQKNSNDSRERNAAFPFEIPYRLIALNSIEGDTILDPFGGTGTTTVACAALKRNSYLVEIEPKYKSNIISRIQNYRNELNEFNENRISKAKEVLEQRKAKNKTPPKYINEYLNLNVVTNQERELSVPIINTIQNGSNEIVVTYSN